jgi:hypothetical protein
MLVVMAIMLILTASSSVLFDAPVSKAGEPSARLARCIDMARATAIAANRTVALRFDPQPVGGQDLVLRFLWARPGAATAGAPSQFRRAEYFPNIALSDSVAIRGRIVEPDIHKLAAGESIVLTTDGQALVGTGKDGFPKAEDELRQGIELGIQATAGGKPRARLGKDVAIVSIRSASGTAIAIQP